MSTGSVLSLPVMLADLEELVTCESFSADQAAMTRSAEVVGALGTRLLRAEPETIVIDGVTHLRWAFGTPCVLLLGHHDTVWPIGSLRAHPWSVADGIARGPGVLDMKAGLVQMFHALASLRSLDGVCVLVTGDEEVGSPTSRKLIEETARMCAAAFVLEAAADGDGALKTARTPGARLEILGGAQRPPMEPAASADLFALASRIAADLGQEPLRAAAVGGASDGNYTAAVGCPTLDGLGAVGGGAHADTEHVEVARMIPRARLLAQLVAKPRRRPDFHLCDSA